MGIADCSPSHPPEQLQCHALLLDSDQRSGYHYAFLLALLPAGLTACLPVGLGACWPVCWPQCLCACWPHCWLALLPLGITACLPTCLPVGLTACGMSHSSGLTSWGALRAVLCTLPLLWVPCCVCVCSAWPLWACAQQLFHHWWGHPVLSWGSTNAAADNSAVNVVPMGVTPLTHIFPCHFISCHYVMQGTQQSLCSNDSMRLQWSCLSIFSGVWSKLVLCWNILRPQGNIAE